MYSTSTCTYIQHSAGCMYCILYSVLYGVILDEVGASTGILSPPALAIITPAFLFLSPPASMFLALRIVGSCRLMTCEMGRVTISSSSGLTCRAETQVTHYSSSAPAECLVSLVLSSATVRSRNDDYCLQSELHPIQKGCEGLGLEGWPRGCGLEPNAPGCKIRRRWIFMTIPGAEVGACPKIPGSMFSKFPNCACSLRSAG